MLSFRSCTAYQRRTATLKWRPDRRRPATTRAHQEETAEETPRRPRPTEAPHPRRAVSPQQEGFTSFTSSKPFIVQSEAYVTVITSKTSYKPSVIRPVYLQTMAASDIILLSHYLTSFPWLFYLHSVREQEEIAVSLRLNQRFQIVWLVQNPEMLYLLSCTQRKTEKSSF